MAVSSMVRARLRPSITCGSPFIPAPPWGRRARERQRSIDKPRWCGRQASSRERAREGHKGRNEPPARPRPAAPAAFRLPPSAFWLTERPPHAVGAADLVGDEARLVLHRPAAGDVVAEVDPRQAAAAGLV